MIQWRIIRNVILCKEHEKKICSQILTITRTQHPLSSLIRDIFGVRMFTVYEEASIEIYCFILERHRVWYSFRFFTLSVKRPLYFNKCLMLNYWYMCEFFLYTCALAGIRICIHVFAFINANLFFIFDEGQKVRWDELVPAGATGLSAAVIGPLTSAAASLGVEVKENGWAADVTDPRESTPRNLKKNTANSQLILQDYPSNVISEITHLPVCEVHPDGRRCRLHRHFGAADDGGHGGWTLRRSGCRSTADLLRQQGGSKGEGRSIGGGFKSAEGETSCGGAQRDARGGGRT